MMKIKNAILSLLLILCMLVPLAACTQGGVEVTSIELNQAEVSVNVGEETTLTYTIFPQGASAAGIKWLSSDPSVATVNNGVVKGISEGTAAIRVSVGGKSSQCTVIVVDPSLSGGAATGISLDKHSLTLAQVGASDTLSATVEPEDASQAVTWSSSNSGIARVADGVVTAVSAGRCVITVRTANNYFDSCVVQVEGEVEDSGLYVSRVASLEGRGSDSEHPFIMGMDSSELLSVEAARQKNGLTFKDFDNNTADVLQVLKDNGITDIRIRVWNHPYATADKSQPYGGGNCDVDNAVALSRRCQAVGLGVIIDFHYSDFWADPGKYRVPEDWKDMNLDDKIDALGTFTEQALTEIKNTGVKITMVQIGNETTDGMAGEDNWANICKLMNAGSAAVRKIAPDAKIAVHFTNAGTGNYEEKALTLKQNDVDYDVFGSSWYPYYTSAGSLAGLINQFQRIHDTYGKDVMVLETGYAWTRDDFDGCGNTGLEETTQPITVQGMANAVREVIEAVANLGDYGLGVSYWGGTWVAASESLSGEVNRALCKEYGCGWATSYAHNYDSSANDGGTMVDNNAFFRSDGTPIEALKVFKYVWEDGHTTDLHADYLEDQELYYTVGQGTIELPKTVKVVLNNGSAMETSAVWAIEKADLESYINEVNMYQVEGTTDFGGTCYCYVWVTNVNILTGGSFEDDQGIIKSYGAQQGGAIYLSNMGDWKVTYNNSNSGNLQLYVSNEAQNAVMGTNSFHFWDSGKIDFKLYQMVDMTQITENGIYSCSFEIQGDHGSNVNVHAYIKVTYSDGTTRTFDGSVLDHFDGWTKWQRTSADVTINDVTKVTGIEVGISVYSEAVLEGPWGNIDNCQFYFGG